MKQIMAFESFKNQLDALECHNNDDNESHDCSKCVECITLSMMKNQALHDVLSNGAEVMHDLVQWYEPLLHDRDLKGLIGQMIDREVAAKIIALLKPYRELNREAAAFLVLAGIFSALHTFFAPELNATFDKVKSEQEQELALASSGKTIERKVM